MNRETFLSNDLHLDLLISREKIEERLLHIAKEIDEKYQGEEITLVMAGKGAFVFLADLIRHLHLPMQIELLSSRYGERGMSKEDLNIEGLSDLDLEGKQVLVVDDIFDTGETLAEIVSTLKKRNPLSVQSLVFLSKDVPRNTQYRPDHVLFAIEDRFVVGYGLDYKEYYRGLPEVFAINP